MTNMLYFGDNLDILRRQDCVADASVDLIYLDPPFNSQAQYNLLFERPGLLQRSAQAGAFLDTWAWGEEAELAYRDIMRIGGSLARLIDALRSAFGESNMMAYIAMMAIRLRELHLKLRPTGSLYLHCDPAASHYIKIALDAIFGATNFRNEIVWKRKAGRGETNRKAIRLGASHDIILFYAKSPETTFERQYRPSNPEYIRTKFTYTDRDGRRYRLDNLTSPSPRPNLRYEYRGYLPPANGWAVSPDRMEEMEREDRLFFPDDKTHRIQRKRFLDELLGETVDDLWDDIAPVNSQAKERMGYPTQKPLTLMRRIIEASSRSGDLILDPFCGCGTTIEAAERAGRRWVGIDVAVHAIKVIEARLADAKSRGDIGPNLDYKVEGMPRDFESAVKLAEKDKYQFQWWANYLFNPHALREQKKGADRGVDGELFFPNGPGRPWGRMLTSVKGGDSVGPSMVRDFRGVLDRENAEMGLFICLRRPTQAMRTEATSARIADTVHGDLPKLQIVSIEEWFEGKAPMLPPLEHLPSAALGRTVRRQPPVPRDTRQPEFLLPLGNVKSESGVVRHLNPQMVTDEPKTRSA